MNPSSAPRPGRGRKSWIYGRRALLLGLAAAGLFAVMIKSGPAPSSAAGTLTNASGIEQACPIAWGRLGGPDEPVICEYQRSDSDRILGSLIGRSPYMIVISTSPQGPRYSIVDRNGRVVADRLTLEAARLAAPDLGLDSLNAGRRDLMMVTDGD